MPQILDYIRAARRDPTTANIESMWRAVFRLPAWYFLPASNPPGPATPTVAEIDGRPWLLAFTGLRHLSAFAQATGRATADDVPMLVIEPDEAIAHVDEVAEHIEGVCFNPGTDETFRAGVDPFFEMHRRVRS